MKIAIPTFGSRVSPRFDCAQFFLIVIIEEGHPAERHEVAASRWAPHERINKLVEFGVDIVVCGGIDCWSAESLQAAGITTYSWVSGTIDEALDALARGELQANALVVADGRCWRQEEVVGGAPADANGQDQAGDGPRRRLQRHRRGRGRGPAGTRSA